MTPEEQLWWHQARLLANGVRYFLRHSKKYAESGRHWLIMAGVESAISQAETLVWHLKKTR